MSFAPALKREAVKYIVSHYGLKLARACRLMKQVRSTQYLHSRKDPKLPLGQRLKESAQERPRWGYRRLHVLLEREGFQLGVNQTYRWYRRGVAAALLAQEAQQDNHAAAGAHAATARQRCLEHGFHGRSTG
jgi:hypothetical protein